MYKNPVLYTLLSIIVFFIGCGPARYVSTDKSEKKVIKVDSLRIAKNLKINKDTITFYQQDLEFTEDEMEDTRNPDEKEITISLNEFLAKYKSDIESNIPNTQEKVVMSIISYMGTPYKYGGITRKGIDCSAFTQKVFMESLNYELPRSSLQQYQLGQEITDRNDLKFGDLLFFNTRRRQRPGHVGIYLWNNLFAHASTSKGVIISSLNDGYYDKRYMDARRIDELNLSD